MSFEDFFKELCSNYVWFQPASMHHKPETFRDVANKVYMQYVASEVFPTIQEARRHVYNKLTLLPGDKVIKPWYVLEAEKKAKETNPLADPNCPHCKGSGGFKTGEDEYSTCPCVNPWIPVTGEERAKRLKEWEATVKGSTMVNALPKPSYKQLAEEGGVLPPKPAPYPCTSKEEAYIRDRHFEYIKANFEARTGVKLPTWINEDDWNILYDNENL